MIKGKKYPRWAPQELIDNLSDSEEIELITNEFQNKLVESWLKQSNNIDACSEEQKREHRARYSDMFLLFPLKEQQDVLEKLLTDIDMEIVWVTLDKEVNDKYAYQHFWLACVDTIAGGRRAYQRSKTEHRKHFQEIKKNAFALTQLIAETQEMYSYEITKLISDERINQLYKNLEVPIDKDKRYARLHLNGLIPSIQAILYNISIRAEEISNEEPLVKKPKSDRAAIHYFVKHLSRYFKTQFGKPLHVVVAATTRVVFNDSAIDADLVSKITKI